VKDRRAIVLVIASFFLISGCVALEESKQSSPVPVRQVQQMKDVPDKLMIADFDSGQKPNKLGGDFGAWDKDPNDETQFCQAEFNPDVKVGMKGFSMKLTYDVDSPEPAYNGFWMKLEGNDFAPYNNIVFSVKGDTQEGFADKFAVELKNMKGEVGKTFVPGITSEWQEIYIPFKFLDGITDFTRMMEFVVVFDDTNSNPKKGSIYIDNIHAAK
jgi:hypothetical protein